MLPNAATLVAFRRLMLCVFQFALRSESGLAASTDHLLRYAIIYDIIR